MARRDRSLLSAVYHAVAIAKDSVDLDVVVLTGTIGLVRLAIGNQRMTVGKNMEQVPDFGGEGMLFAIARAVAPPNFPGGICAGGRNRVKHGEYRRRPNTRAQQDHRLVTRGKCEAPPRCAYLNEVAGPNAVVEVAAPRAISTLHADAIGSAPAGPEIE